MKVIFVYKGIGGIKRLYDFVRRCKEMNEEAKQRLKIIDFFKKYGLKATEEAFGVKKSTIYRYMKILRDSGGRIDALNNKSRAPKRKRVSNVDFRIIKFIKDIREERGDIGKEKIKILLDKYCKENNIKSISSSTIGRIIKKYNLFFHKELTHFGKRKVKYKRKKLRRNGYKPVNPGDLVQIDSIEVFYQNVKRYIITAVDVKSKFAFAYSYKNLNSKSALDFIKKLEYVAPFRINRIQTDNGKEFHKYFDDYLAKNNIIHYFNYPRHPQHNANIERLNKTIEDEFLNNNLEYIEDEKYFNHNLINYLIFYNKDRPHKSLNYMSPSDYLINNLNFSNMLWTSAVEHPQ